MNTNTKQQEINELKRKIEELRTEESKIDLDISLDDMKIFKKIVNERKEEEKLREEYSKGPLLSLIDKLIFTFIFIVVSALFIINGGYVLSHVIPYFCFLAVIFVFNIDNYKISFFIGTLFLLSHFVLAIFLIFFY